MLTTTTRKVGNSVAVSIPKQFHIEPGITYVIYQSSNGGLTLVPKIENPFESSLPYEDSSDIFWQTISVEELNNDLQS